MERGKGENGIEYLCFKFSKKLKKKEERIVLPFLILLSSSSEEGIVCN